jgi:hypothetical protein
MNKYEAVLALHVAKNDIEGRAGEASELVIKHMHDLHYFRVVVRKIL